VEYDGISVMRDGVSIADLPGASTRFDDPDTSAEMAIYTVEGRIGAFSSPGASCVSRGTWMVEVGDALAPADASRIVIPMYVTTPETVEGFDFHLDIDTSRFRLVRDFEASLAGTVDQPLPEYFHMGIGGPHRAPTAGIIYDQLAPREAEKDLSPGLRQRVFNFIFEPLGEFEDGESFRVGLHQASFVLDRGALSRRPDVVVPGEIRLGPSVPPPVAALVASADEDPRLSWETPAEYDRIVIERNGSPAGETDGDGRSWVDTGAPRGVHVYKVFGIADGARSHPAVAFVSTFLPEGAFIRGDANGDGKIDVADPVATLEFLFHTGNIACEDAADIDDDGIITIADAIAGLGFLFQSPGSLKAPGGFYPWFDPTPDSLDCGR
jgi:hypothetical protein